MKREMSWVISLDSYCNHMHHLHDHKAEEHLDSNLSNIIEGSNENIEDDVYRDDDDDDVFTDMIDENINPRNDDKVEATMYVPHEGSSCAVSRCKSQEVISNTHIERPEKSELATTNFGNNESHSFAQSSSLDKEYSWEPCTLNQRSHSLDLLNRRTRSVCETSPRDVGIKRVRAWSDRFIRYICRKEKIKRRERCTSVPPYSTYVSIYDPLLSHLIEKIDESHSTTSKRICATEFYKDAYVGGENMAVDFILQPLGSRKFYMLHVIERNPSLPAAE